MNAIFLTIDGIKKIFIGSAGFTDNMQGNKNIENMILLKILNDNEQLQEAYDHSMKSYFKGKLFARKSSQ